MYRYEAGPSSQKTIRARRGPKLTVKSSTSLTFSSSSSCALASSSFLASSCFWNVEDSSSNTLCLAWNCASY